jgi:hypothetical protein
MVPRQLGSAPRRRWGHLRFPPSTRAPSPSCLEAYATLGDAVQTRGVAPSHCPTRNEIRLSASGATVWLAPHGQMRPRRCPHGPTNGRASSQRPQRGRHGPSRQSPSGIGSHRWRPTISSGAATETVSLTPRLAPARASAAPQPMPTLHAEGAVGGVPQRAAVGQRPPAAQAAVVAASLGSPRAPPTLPRCPARCGHRAALAVASSEAPPWASAACAAASS